MCLWNKQVTINKMQGAPHKKTEIMTYILQLTDYTE